MTKQLRPISDGKPRCGWVGDKPHFIAYHDREWGVPIHDDRKHFEMLLLEGAQAGLTWETILLRRDGYRRAFAEFDPKKVERFTAKKKAVLLKNPGIIRNRLKIDSAVTNAQAFLTVQEEFGSFDRYVWQFVGGKPIVNRWARMAQVPATSAVSDASSAISTSSRRSSRPPSKRIVSCGSQSSAAPAPRPSRASIRAAPPDER